MLGYNSGNSCLHYHNETQPEKVFHVKHFSHSPTQPQPGVKPPAQRFPLLVDEQQGKIHLETMSNDPFRIDKIELEPRRADPPPRIHSMFHVKHFSKPESHTPGKSQLCFT